MINVIYILVSLAFSWSSVWLVKLIDMSMDYGNILDFIRLRRFKKANPDIVNAVMEQANKEPYSESVNLMDAAYWTVYESSRSKLLKGIICISCMTVRIHLIIQLAIGTAAYLMNTHVTAIALSIIFSMGLNYFFLKKSDG